MSAKVVVRKQVAVILSAAQLEHLANDGRITIHLQEIELTIKAEYSSPACSIGGIY